MLLLSKKSTHLELTSRNAIAELERKRNEEAERKKIEYEANNLKERAKKVANQKSLFFKATINLNFLLLE
jgi:hypothetical protein